MSSMTQRRCRVLLAGDLEQLRPMLAPLLDVAGLQTVEAKDGAAALQMLCDDLAEVALVDLVLPDMSGLYFLRQISNRRKIPIILFAPKEDAPMAAVAKKLGARDFLIKPLLPEEVLRALEAARRDESPRPENVLPLDAEARMRQEHKLEMLGRLTSAVAHDLNNQMTVIFGHTQLLERQVDAAGTLAENLGEIHRATERAAALTRQLLDFSRKEELVLRVVDLNALVAGMMNMVRRLLPENIEVDTRLHASDAHVLADSGQLEHVLMNLTLNARDAMPQGGRLTLTTANVVLEAEPADATRAASVRPFIMLVVSDTGCGMDAATQAHLFEPFFTTKPLGQGTGLGLNIVRKTIEGCKGRVQVASVPGRGTSFTVYLPQVGTAAPESPAPAPSESPRGTETVLLVEDDKSVLNTIREFLRRFGYHVLEARGCSEALELGEHHDGPIQLLVTDVVLPLMDGPELAQRLARFRPNLRVLYISGYDAPPQFEKVQDRSGVAFIQKPFPMDVLARLIRKLLDE